MKKKYQFFQNEELFLIGLSTIIASIATTVFFFKGLILAYGDAESHINIAKRVVDSLTPGFAQLGGIWLPIPHMLMLPFVWITPLWRTGIAGSIVGGLSFVVASLFVYKFTMLLFNHKVAARIAFFVFVTNPNILYMQSTPMSELPLLCFFVLSIYYFIYFLLDEKKIVYLIAAAFFGFIASLSRYDGWFLVGFEVLALGIYYAIKRQIWNTGQGKIVLYSTLAFFGIFLWFLWDFLILGDPLYFTNSPFSAKSQQQGWLARGELVTYKHLFLSFVYYLDTVVHNIGFILFVFVMIGLIFYLFDRGQKNKFFVLLVLCTPFIFYWVTLFLGQSVIFLPDLTPKSFQWHLFNARYGIMMVPFAAVFFAYFAKLLNKFYRWWLILIFASQLILFQSGVEQVMTIADGTTGLSAAKKVDAQFWMAKHYDKGLVLLDDYARTLSIIKSGLPIDKVVYVGNKPYWQESLNDPQKHVTWVVLQKDDAVWKTLYENKANRGKLFKYFVKEYTSPEILIFKRNTQVPA